MKKIFTSSIFYILFVAIFGFFAYHKLKKEYEFKLFTAANTLGCILPERVIDEAYQNKAQNLIFYDSLMNKANQVARIHQVTYVYALILKNDSLFFVISSYTENDLRKDQVTYYLDYYPEGPEIFKKAFKDKIKTPIYTKIADSWGAFKTIIIYKKTALNNPYLLCADISYEEIDHKKYNIIYISLFIFSIIVIISLATIAYEEKKKLKQ